MNSFKVFDNFGDGLKEIVTIVPEINSICDSIINTLGVKLEDITPKDLAAEFTKIVMADFPYVDFRSPAVSISYREVGFKSRSVLSFGWKYMTTGTGNLQYSFRISFFSHSDQVKEMESKLVEAGWEQSGEKHNFFPYKTKFKKEKTTEPKKNNPKFKKHVKEEVVEYVDHNPEVENNSVSEVKNAPVEEPEPSTPNTSSEY